MIYYHVDVFSSKRLSGNGLIVALYDENLTTDEMIAITQEFRQYETIFIQKEEEYFSARIFTPVEELEFAGHPILGATAVIHQLFYNEIETISINIKLQLKDIVTTSIKSDNTYHVEMDQGVPEYIKTVDKKYYSEIARRINLDISDLNSNLPIEVVSTGLPHLLIPVRRGLKKCKIIGAGFEEFIAHFGAKFAYIFDADELECRTWDNHGKAEDIATGSAAGPLCAYLIKHGIKKPGEVIEINQGKFLNRPSVIKTWQCDEENKSIYIAGDVSFFARGELVI